MSYGALILAAILGGLVVAILYEWRDRKRRDANPPQADGAGGPGEEQK